MRALIAVTIAAIYGLSMRLLYGEASGILEVMSGSFLLGCPVIVGFLTMILIPGKKRISGGGAFFIPWITAALVLLITVQLEVEGMICWAMLLPLFLALAGIGGLIGNHFRNKRIPRNENDDFDFGNKQNKAIVPLVMLLPLVTGLIEGDRTLHPEHYELERSIVIEASPERIWNTIGHIGGVGKAEKETRFTNAMGFPRHLYTTTDTLARGGKRLAVYEGGLFFDETITRFEPAGLLELRIRTDPDKIPATVLDEHVVIGGKHLDLETDVYRIQPISNGRCRLFLRTRYMLNTPINWYSNLWAEWLMDDLLIGELKLIAKRATAA